TLADLTPPAAPGTLNAGAVSAGAVNLGWEDNSDNESEFQIERKTTAASFAQVASVAANITSFQDSNLAADTTYTYRVRSANPNGTSAYSNEASATTLPGTDVPGLEAHWELDNDLSDASGNGHDATLGGGATFSSDRVIGSHALTLDGVDDLLDAGPFSLAESFTLASWVRIDSSSSNIQTMAANSGGGFAVDGFRFFVNTHETADGTIRFETGNGVVGDTAATAPGVFAFDQWNHVAVVVDSVAGTALIYYNGVNVSADASVLSNFRRDGVIHWGEMNGSGFWLDGAIDDTRIYARALEADEVAGLATPGSGGHLSVQLSPSAPTLVATPLQVDIASVTGGEGVLEYSWDFNDGNAPTPFLSTSIADHVFSSAGHYPVQVVVRDQQGQQASDSYLQTIHQPVSVAQPVHSSSIVFDSARSRVWNVNPDNDSVTAIDGSALARLGEYPVGDHPRTLTITADGSIWVSNQDDSSISVLAGDGSLLQTIELDYGSAPYGIVFAPQAAAVYVSLEGEGQLLEISALDYNILRSVDVGPSPRGIAVTEDGQRIFVTRFISSQDVGEVVEINAAAFAVSSVKVLAADPGPDTPNSGRGIPNYISSITLSPDGTRAWVPAKKDNTLRGQFIDGQALTFENSVRAIVSSIDLATGLERIDERIDLDNSSLPLAIEYSPLGDWVFVALSGNNLIDIRDAYSGSSVAGLDTGLTPQGLVLSADGSLLFTQNFMGRSVSVFDVFELSSGSGVGVFPLTTISTVANEALSATVLRGKQIFYNAADPRMGLDGYLSCASCHLDGGQDGRVWDFSDRGEGLRNTIDLRGRAGTGHGNLHWTANFDEVQDFENDIRNAFGGTGFLSDPQFSASQDPLGSPKAGLNSDLDALAAYVTSLTAVPASPYRAADGSLTSAAETGRLVFIESGCADCHAGSTFTDGQRHDVGTIQLSSGNGIGQPLSGVGFETPTLKGVWESAPYLHNGQAETLTDVLLIPGHGLGSMLGVGERAQLIDYLLQIDNDSDVSLSCQPDQPSASDCDSDGVTDDIDNCSDVVNPDQLDTDKDGHGNRCDADFDQTCMTNFADLSIMQEGFFVPDPLLDLNSSGGPVNFADLSIMSGLFFRPPGPSATGALCEL
ncbi:MAG: PKD domain-containing protein, partial [Gammaproteobacteria bacterium]|nr:PKD domain-containing protein [Gammaproteobacteria bacterium]